MTLCKPKRKPPHREKLFSARSAESNFSFSETKFRDKYSRWMSADPAVSDYIPSNSEQAKKLPAGGVYSINNLNLYHYGANNPLKYKDPDGAINIVANKSSNLSNPVSRNSYPSCYVMTRNGHLGNKALNQMNNQKTANALVSFFKTLASIVSGGGASVGMPMADMATGNASTSDAATSTAKSTVENAIDNATKSDAGSALGMGADILLSLTPEKEVYPSQDTADGATESKFLAGFQKYLGNKGIRTEWSMSTRDNMQSGARSSSVDNLAVYGASGDEVMHYAKQYRDEHPEYKDVKINGE